MILPPILRTFDELHALFKDNIFVLNKLNGIAARETVFIPLDNLQYDYDMTEYQGTKITSKYFKNEWSFGYLGDKVFDASIGEPVFPVAGIAQTKIYMQLHDEFYERYGWKPEIDNVLSHAINRSLDPHINITDYDFDCKLYENDELKRSTHDFYFNSIQLLGVDNINREILFHGTYEADSFGMDYIQMNPAYIPIHLEYSKPCDHFYKEILLDAYTHYVEGNYKMAYFNAFAAFDNFVNIVSNTARVKDRLSNKFKLAFNKNEIHENFAEYDSMRQLKDAMKKYSFERVRNDIAHGNTKNSDWHSDDMKDLANKMYVFTSATILCFEKGFCKFQELKKYLKKNKYCCFNTIPDAILI